MAKMNWRRAQLYGRPTLDKRFEFDAPDRAAKWLRAIERRLQERRVTAVVSSSAILKGSRPRNN
jgi:hypothetical protein